MSLDSESSEGFPAQWMQSQRRIQSRMICEYGMMDQQGIRRGAGLMMMQGCGDAIGGCRHNIRISPNCRGWGCH
ncbi:Hypothetical protein FKW44_006950 [Caligus rogercresseyi]|uniref:Uncharacterized protein n=1 Tax=Caligus rogercresseyi TaxID=217165 RepID=A0A7T8QT92_CALRO|nr:Hypothetical protein FKW44_006950 [Caligus rogercresseyi]